MIEVVGYLVGGLIALFGALIIAGPYIRILTVILTKTEEERGTSLMPLFGPLAFIGGIAITPLPFSHWLWLAFLVDINTIAIPSMAMFAVKSLFSSDHEQPQHPPDAR